VGLLDLCPKVVILSNFHYYLSVLLGFLGDLFSSRCLEVVCHPRVEGEDGGRGSDLGAHVADGAHAGARDRVNSLAVVFDNSATEIKNG